MRSLLKIAAVTVAFLLVCAGIYSLYRAEEGRITVRTSFDDVSDLAIDAPVHLADVRIGRVSDIELTVTDGVSRADVTLRVDESAGVPADSVALLRRTSVLGEKFVELRPVGPRDAGAAVLTDGTDLGPGQVVSDLEQLVGTGEELFAVIAENELAIILDEGATAFRDQGDTLRQTLDDFSEILEGYESRSDDIRTLVQSLAAFSSTTGPAADAHAEALSNLAVTVGNLEDQRDELIELLDALDEVAREGEAILDDHLDEIARVLDALAATTTTVVAHQDDLARILQSLPGHNINLPTGVQDNFVQVLNDVVVCGFPGGGERDTPVYTCTNKYAEPIPRQSEEPDAE